MKKSIITIAQQSKISWHPLTAYLYKTLSACYDDAFIRNLSQHCPNQHHVIPQVVFFIQTGTSEKTTKRKNEINAKTNNYQIVAGVFNPWFVESGIKDKHSQIIAICLSPATDMSKQAFEQAVCEFILGDFFKTVGTANMRFIANGFFALSNIDAEIAEKASINRLFTALTGDKLTADSYGKLLGMTRMALYKQLEQLKKLQSFVEQVVSK